MLEGYARLHGLRFEVVPVARWEEAIPMLLAGRGDLLAGINDTPERRRTIAFTEELLPARSVVVNLKPAAPVATTAALLAIRVARSSPSPPGQWRPIAPACPRARS